MFLALPCVFCSDGIGVFAFYSPNVIWHGRTEKALTGLDWPTLCFHCGRVFSFSILVLIIFPPFFFLIVITITIGTGSPVLYS